MMQSKDETDMYILYKSSAYHTSRQYHQCKGDDANTTYAVRAPRLRGTQRLTVEGQATPPRIHTI